MASSSDEIFMNIPAVQQISKTLHTVSDVLKGIDKGLKALSHVLEVTAFMGAVGGKAVQMYVDQLEKQVRDLYEFMAELSKDTADAVTAYESGAQQGSTKFH